MATFVVGRDCQAVFIAPNGQQLDLTNMTEIEVTPESKTARSDIITGPALERFIPGGHRIRVTTDRRDATNDRIMNSIEQGWWNTGSADGGTQNTGQFYIYINELSGGITTWRYQGVSIKETSSGSFRHENAIKQSYEGYAQKRFVQ